MKPVDCIYLGPPKTASTWLYECLKEHPDVQVSKDGETYFFDIYYGYGEDWYEKTQFPQPVNGRIRADCGPSYAYNLTAIERIHRHNPNMKLAVGLRNPVDRSFSNYWHIKKKDLVSLRFDESLVDYTAFWTWIHTSMLAPGIEKCIELFGRKNLFIINFDDLKKGSEQILRDYFEFIGVNKDFIPSSLHKKMNVAGPKFTPFRKASYKISRSIWGDDALMEKARTSKFYAYISGKDEYVRGVDPEFRETLIKIFEPEISHLEKLLEMDLSHWRK